MVRREHVPDGPREAVHRARPGVGQGQPTTQAGQRHVFARAEVISSMEGRHRGISMPSSAVSCCVSRQHARRAASGPVLQTGTRAAEVGHHLRRKGVEHLTAGPRA
jgi:hypothetical protein